MSQTQRVRGRATTIFSDEDGTHVIYHQTAVVSFNAKRITLRTGGWRTVTTKTRMNQAANQFRLGFSVYQKDREWYVRLPHGDEMMRSQEMTFNRPKAP